MQTDMQSTRALITGGTSGLGLALVRELHRARRTASLSSRGRRSALRRSHASTARTASSATSRRRHDIHRIALQATGVLGGLDVLINNASDLGPTPLALLGDTRMRGLRARARDECARAVPTDEGAARFAGGVRSRGSRRSRAERFERRRGQCVRALGRIRCEQGRARAHDAHLERRVVVAGCEVARARSRRHGHADACAAPSPMPTARR